METQALPGDVKLEQDDLSLDDLPVEEAPEEEQTADSDGDEEDFAAVLATIKREKEASNSSSSGGGGGGGGTPAVEEVRRRDSPSVEKRPPVVDDFIRNFLVVHGMSKTLDCFQTEWYELQEQRQLRADAVPVPDVYARNQQLEEQVATLSTELKRVSGIAEKAKQSWDKFKAERDVHRMHHRRVAQEKNKLIVDMRRLKNHYSKYEPTLKMLRKKYEDVSKDKMLVVIERDRLSLKVEALQKQLQENSGREAHKEVKVNDDKKANLSRNTPLPLEDRVNPHAEVVYDPVPAESFRAIKAFKAHPLAVGGVALHPKKPVLATVSDDRTWKLWSIPDGNLIMSGDGHTDWVAGCDFHPEGTVLATGSGDNTVKLWDFKKTACVSTFSDHTQAVWDVVFHDKGDFLASASMDHSAKLWDIHTGKCRQTFRGHVDSVNAVCFQPYGSTICTASGDKTVSLWDLRSGLCVQTFYGHHNAVNSATFSLKGDSIASCDSDGVAKVWDIRMVGERAHIVTASGRVPLNDVAFDRSGKRLLLASESGVIKVYSVEESKLLLDLQGHEDAVQALALDPAGQFLISAGSDSSFRLWGQ